MMMYACETAAWQGTVSNLLGQARPIVNKSYSCMILNYVNKHVSLEEEPKLLDCILVRSRAEEKTEPTSDA